MEEAPNIVQLIGQLGFPIAVCLWFMWRDYQFLSSLKDSLAKIVGLIENVIDKKV